MSRFWWCGVGVLFFRAVMFFASVVPLWLWCPSFVQSLWKRVRYFGGFVGRCVEEVELALGEVEILLRRRTRVVKSAPMERIMAGIFHAGVCLV